MTSYPCTFSTPVVAECMLPTFIYIATNCVVKVGEKKHKKLKKKLFE